MVIANRMATQCANPRPYIEPIFIGLAGRTGAGKTSAAKYLSDKYGFQYKRYSQVLAEWRSVSNAERGQLQQVGWSVMAGGFQEELNARLIAGIDPTRNAAIDGLRHVVDFQSLSSRFGYSFEMIFLDAARETRFGRQTRFSTVPEFDAAESHPVEAHIDDLRPWAAITIRNDGYPEQLYQQLDIWLASRRSGDRR